MKTNNISAWIEAKDNTYLIYIDDLTAEDYSCAELRDFLSNPSDSKYLAASWDEGVVNLQMDDSSSSATSNNHWKTFLSRSGIMTKLLVILSISLTLLTSFGENLEITRYFLIADITQYRGHLSEVLNGEIWRLVTPIFLHFMVIHILFNMMWLWDLGGTVERVQSKGFLLFFVISIGVLSNLIQYYSSGPAFGGMSGVVYGLLGYTWIRSLNARSSYQLPKSIIGFMLAWLVLGYTGLIGAIGNAAHLSGLILGMAYGFAWNRYE